MLTIYDEHTAQIKELIGIDYSYGAYRRHIRTSNHLQDFIKQEYKREDYFVKEIGRKFINRFYHHLVTKKIDNQNTTMKTINVKLRGNSKIVMKMTHLELNEIEISFALISLNKGGLIEIRLIEFC